MMPIRDLTDQKFGRLTAIKIGCRDKNRAILWLCKCDCGMFTYVSSSSLVRGQSKSCGCFQKELAAIRSTTHGHTKGKRTSEYLSWSSMLSRCYNKNKKGYHNYGGRSIEVCDRWRGIHGFENFLADMGYKPYPHASHDRIDNDGNYELNNCKWATPQEQAKNRRCSRAIQNISDELVLKEIQRRWPNGFPKP